MDTYIHTYIHTYYIYQSLYIIHDILDLYVHRLGISPSLFASTKKSRDSELQVIITQPTANGRRPMSCFKRSIPWNGWNIPGMALTGTSANVELVRKNHGELVGGTFFPVENKRPKIYRRDDVPVWVGVRVFCFFFRICCWSKKWHETKLNYVYCDFYIFSAVFYRWVNWYTVILTRWWIYIIVGASFNSTVVLEKTPIFFLPQI